MAEWKIHVGKIVNFLAFALTRVSKALYYCIYACFTPSINISEVAKDRALLNTL